MGECADDANPKKSQLRRTGTSAIGIEESTAATRVGTAGIGLLLCTLRRPPGQASYESHQGKLASSFRHTFLFCSLPCLLLFTKNCATLVPRGALQRNKGND